MMNGMNLTPADIGAIMGNNNDGFNGNGAWWLIILLLFANGGFGYGGGGAAQNYVLTSDFATLQRMITEGDSRTESKLDSLANGLSSLGYDQLGQMNNIQSTLTNQHFDILSRLSDCCCQNREAIAGVNFNLANATRDIVENQNSNARAIIETLNAQEMSRKDEKIAELTSRLQCIENGTYVVNQLKTPAPVPAYVVQNPYCNCNCNNGYPYQYGTTIA